MKSPMAYGCVAFMIVMFVVTFLFLRVWNKKQQQRKSNNLGDLPIKFDWPERKKIAAVEELIRKLDDQMVLLSQRKKGIQALRDAQTIAEQTYYSWLNEHYGMFHHLLCSGNGVIAVVGIKNGSFAYSLPKDLERYLKGRRK